MCGIFGYVGPARPTAGMVLGALRKLEYRGYDSWGVAVGVNGHIDVRKHAGRIADATVELPDATIGFGHTRWATHGGVTDRNAHPHLDCSGRFAVIHNGIIENFRALRARLQVSHTLVSETDTEVVPHLVEEAVGGRTDSDSFVEGVRSAFAQLRGLNAIIVMDNLTKQLVAVKNVSPLVVGAGADASYIASDAIALVGYAERVHYLDDGEVAVLGVGGVRFLEAATGSSRPPAFVALQLDATDTALHGHAHYLDKEIHEQPRVLRNISENYAEPIRRLAAEIRDSYGTFLIGCGTASYAALTGQYLFSRIARRHVNFAVGSEFKYQEHFLTDRSLVIALSQSGETADIIEAAMSAKRVGARVAALVNVPGSTLDRMADFSLHLGAGPEQSVLSTKAYSAKVAILMLTAHVLNGSEHVGREHLWRAVDGVERAVSEESVGLIRHIAARMVDRDHAFIIGRGLSYPTALEAALKIKEVSYIHAEGFAGGELKHGVIALVEEGTPCIVFSPLDETRDDILSGAMEMKSRGGWIIGISPENDDVFDVHVRVEDVGDASPLVGVAPAQLLGYHLALLRGLDPDKPRNLAKSVTVK
ncbi:MAG TPA: glutamine--fructose-6-phosphate transaminase (isomerizing) [Thermomicrobiaceae bacterium]|nr:glutamine--fructose-6-phosphate transaminase (isomerizing) [Thermomicrobiaceae bacterium]